MTLAKSSLALAAHGLSEALEKGLTDIHVIVDNPAAASKLHAETNDKHFLNIFFYRVAPSAVHAAQASDEPYFLRVFALLTPFAKKTVDDTEDYPNLRILGEVIRYFHENPVSGILETPLDANGTSYRIQAIPQAPGMEELNHIWTTQGSDLSYRLSAAYEFALVPVDPKVLAQSAGQVETTLFQVEPDMDRADEKPVGYDTEFKSYPGLSPTEAETWDGPPHLPQMLALDGGGNLVETLDLAANATSVDLAIAGSIGEKAHVTLIVRDGNGVELRRTTVSPAIATVRLDDPAAKVPEPDADALHPPPRKANPAAKTTMPVDLTGGAKTLVAEIRAADAGGTRLSPDRVGNTLTLTVGGGP